MKFYGILFVWTYSDTIIKLKMAKFFTLAPILSKLILSIFSLAG